MVATTIVLAVLTFAVGVAAWLLFGPIQAFLAWAAIITVLVWLWMHQETAPTKQDDWLEDPVTIAGLMVLSVLFVALQILHAGA